MVWLKVWLEVWLEAKNESRLISESCNYLHIVRLNNVHVTIALQLPSFLDVSPLKRVEV